MDATRGSTPRALRVRAQDVEHATSQPRSCAEKAQERDSQLARPTGSALKAMPCCHPQVLCAGGVELGAAAVVKKFQAPDPPDHRRESE
jgi:hypothetical protein